MCVSGIILQRDLRGRCVCLWHHSHVQKRPVCVKRDLHMWKETYEKEAYLQQETYPRDACTQVCLWHRTCVQKRHAYAKRGTDGSLV